jgi:hypothetical protein
LVEPARPIAFFDLCAAGSAMAIDALPALADGNEPRELTQEWARAIYEDQPASTKVAGIRYRTAYNGGIALAVWDAAGIVRTVSGNGGWSEDYQLRARMMLGRVKNACAPRRIIVDTIDPSRCRLCRNDPDMSPDSA